MKKPKIKSREIFEIAFSDINRSREKQKVMQTQFSDSRYNKAYKAANDNIGNIQKKANNILCFSETAFFAGFTAGALVTTIVISVGVFLLR